MRAIGFTALAALLLASCAAVPHDPPKVTQVASGRVGLSTQSASLAGDWWTAFDDPQLDRLTALALADNPSLEKALARVRAAQAEIDAEHSGLLPHVTGGGTVQYLRNSKNFIGGSSSDDNGSSGATSGGSSPSHWLGIVGASLSWNLDLFGRQRAAVDRARATAQAATLDAAAARLTIATSLAETYVGLAQAKRQIEVADGFVQTRQRALSLIQTRIRDQLSSRLDEETARTLLAQAQQAKVRAGRQYELLVHAIAALVGRGADFYPQVTQPTLVLDRPPGVPDALPADLLVRRPDLLADQARIDATEAGRRIARAAFMPNVSISALAGFASFGLGSLISAASATYGGGPMLSIPIFEGGKLRAQYRGATADLDTAVADYDDAVLGAVRESADAITNVRTTDTDLVQQNEVVASLRETVRLNNVRITEGLGSQLDAIDSGFRLLQGEQDLVQLQADALTRRIQLIAALGGGFDPSRPLASAPAAEPRS